jgi:hypothetical protein
MSDFLDDIESAFASVDGFYQSAPSLEFDVSEADDGKTIVLTASGISIDGELITSTANIVVRVPPAIAAEITVSPASAETQYGSMVSISVYCSKQPAANVTVSITSGNAAAGTVSVSSVTFTTTDWATPKEVLLTASIEDGSSHVEYEVVTGDAVSADSEFSGLSVANVSVVHHPRHEATVITLTDLGPYTNPSTCNDVNMPFCPNLLDCPDPIPASPDNATTSLMEVVGDFDAGIARPSSTIDPTRRWSLYSKITLLSGVIQNVLLKSGGIESDGTCTWVGPDILGSSDYYNGSTHTSWRVVGTGEFTWWWCKESAELQTTVTETPATIASWKYYMRYTV